MSDVKRTFEEIFVMLSHLSLLCIWSDGPRPSQKEIISLRAFMLLFLKQLILKVRQQRLLNITQPARNNFVF